MPNEDWCVAVIGLLLAALLGSPWVVYIIKRGEGRDRDDRRNNRGRKPPRK